MAREIERKFLVANDSWRDGSPGVEIAQGYLTRDLDRTVRIRVGGERAWVTIKGRSKGISRAEFEYEIPLGDARELLAMCLPAVVEKTRYAISHEGHVWEIDVFHGANAGLIVAEVELADETIEPGLPPWLGDEVSADSRYFNSALASRPFSSW